MKKIMLWMIAFLTLSAGAMQAQDLTGTWQGTLDVGKGLRTVLKISKDDGKWKTVFYSIDQGGRPLPASSVVVDGPSIKAEFLAMGGAYEGKLSADGNAIAGSFTQGGRPLPLNLVRATKDTAWVIPEPPVKLPPMAKDAKPGFEVATIKLSKPEQMGKGYGINGHQVRTINTSLLDLIEFAYNVQAKQVINLPSGLDRPIADQTGLTGKYDFDITFTPDDSMMGGMGSKLPPPPDGAEAPPSLFTALQDQAGLKLEPTKAPVDVLVVDHAEKPSED